MRRTLPAVFVCVAALMSSTIAGSELSVRSDEIVTDTDGGRRILKGNVVVELKNVRFEADEVIEYVEDQTPVKYEAAGDPVFLEQSGGVLEGLQQGTCDKLVYLVREKTLLLTNYELRLSSGLVQKGKRLKLILE